MKLALSVLCFAVSAFSLSTFAATNGCDVVKCGSYVQGPDEDGVTLTISFVATKVANELTFGWIYAKNGKEMDGGVRLTMKLQEDGSFTAWLGDHVYASGVCGQSACTYGMVPNTMEGKLVMQTGTFKFNGDTMDVSVFAPDLNGNADFVSKGTLKKQ
jgi:hypothetical protein